LLETVKIILSAVPLKLTLMSTSFTYYHTCRNDNGYGSRRHLLSRDTDKASSSFQIALKSPFSKFHWNLFFQIISTILQSHHLQLS